MAASEAFPAFSPGAVANNTELPLRQQQPPQNGITARPGLEFDAPPASEPAAEEDALLYGDQEDAQCFMQPAISPVATRLTSPRTPAAEKAAAMEQVMDGFFDPVPRRGPGDQGDGQPGISSVMLTAASLPHSPLSPTAPRVGARSSSGTLADSDWPPEGHAAAPSSDEDTPITPFPPIVQTQHRQQQQQQPESSARQPSALYGVFGEGRHRRSSSVGADALKRLSKALPSISLPSGLFPNLTSSSFFSSSASSAAQRTMQPGQTSSALSRVIQPNASLDRTRAPGTPPAHASRRPPSVVSVQSYKLRRSTSADSMLYTTLSRVSSLGDDDRFENIRDQVNSRFKAIMDSFDRPSFKMPQLPNIIPAPLKKNPSFADPTASYSGRPRAQLSSAAKPAAAPKDGAAMLEAVLERLTGDVVILGGYRGSVLRSAEPPHQQLWVPMKVGLGIRKVNLEVGLDPEDEETMPERIFASGMLQNIGPVDISRRLFRKLRDSPNARAGRLRVHDFAYDWRLSPARISRQLLRFLEGLPCNNKADGPHGAGPRRGALVLAHSLGGLITRHAVNKRPELFAGVVYVGVPQRCINILGPLRNGDAVLLNEKVLTAQVNFSFRTSFALLPEDGFCFMSKDMKHSYPIDFFDAENWVRYGLCPCVDPKAPQPPSPLWAGAGDASSTSGMLTSTMGSLRDLSSSFPSLPLRSSSRTPSDARSRARADSGAALAAAAMTSVKDRTLAPQLASKSAAQSATLDPVPAEPSSSSNKTPGGSSTENRDRSPSRRRTSRCREDSPEDSMPEKSSDTEPSAPSSSAPLTPILRAPNDDNSGNNNSDGGSSKSREMVYLARTLAETKQFRLETQHVPALSAANTYPPLAVIYGKDTPTVYGARVAGREAIGGPEMYDSLVFRSGDGVVLAREAMLPAGYEVVRGGRVSTTKGHISMLGDLSAVARALDAVLRGRKKGIGLGIPPDRLEPGTSATNAVA